MVWVLAAALVVPLVVAAFIAALSRRKKTHINELRLIGMRAHVQKQLDPIGAVIVEGELWPAESRTTEVIGSGVIMRVVGVRDHLLMVEVDH